MRGMEQFTEPRDPKNIFLHDVWEPWARSVNYTGDCLFPEGVSWEKYFDGVGMKRWAAIEMFGYAIPSSAALAAIQRASGRRVLEVGSGTGYWAMLLQARGVDVVAVDDGSEFKYARWFEHTVKQDGAEYIKAHGGCRDRALFLCWPRNGDQFLEHYGGDTLIWIGEPDGGCTWELDLDAWRGWRQVEEVAIPTWAGIHDVLRVYSRRKLT